jgi:hypothetical protein
MFKLPNSLPSRTSSVEEITDYVEWECIKKTSISMYDVMKPIMYANDEIVVDGIEDESDLVINRIDDVLVEMGRRQVASSYKYPFSIEARGYKISVNNFRTSYWIYTYLLLCTRLNMRDHRTWKNIDGAKVFEKLSAVIAKSYFGKRSESEVFGTAEEGRFEEKVNLVCACIGEGREFTNRSKHSPTAQDDKLDIVVWKSFSDQNRSKIIGFGQCKTGTSWDDSSMIELQPKDFCEKWFLDVPVSAPVKIFFSSQYFPLDDYAKAKNAGLVFDRFRILDYLPNDIDLDLLGRIQLWCRTAIYNMAKRN